MKKQFTFFIFILPIVSFVLFFSSYQKTKQLTLLKKQIQETTSIYLQKEKENSDNLMIIQNHLEPDPFYINNELETISLLQREKEALNKRSFLSQEEKSRLEELEDNQIQFSPGSKEKFSLFSQNLEKLTSTIEVDIEDLLTLLKKTDPNQKQTPQLIIQELKLKREQKVLGNEIYKLDMTLLKRDFL